MKKTLKALSTPLILSLCISFSLPSAFAADRLNWHQRKELFLKGTVTNQRTHQTWDVVLVPGIENISHGAKNGYIDAGHDFRTLGKKRFWIQRGDEFKDGFTFSKHVIVRHWFNGIKGDYKQAVRENRSITPGEIGSGFERFASWSWFGIKLIARTVWMPVGAAGGVAYSIAAPAIVTVSKPVIEGLTINGAIRGAVVPGILYVWNGAAWVADSIGNVPTKESYFVHIAYQNPENNQKTELVIDNQGFATIVQASVLEAMTSAQKAALQAKIDAIQAQITPLQNQQQQMANQEEQADQNLQNSAAQQAIETIYQQAMASSKVSVSSGAKDIYLNQAKLRELVTQDLKAMGVESPSKSLIDGIVQQITQNLAEMRVNMSAPTQAAK